MNDDEPETTDDESLDDVDAALESSGFVEGDEPDDADEPDEPGWLDKLSEMSGTGKSLDDYENDPVASVFASDADDVPRGAKHIARGVDGLSPVAAAHPLIDIGVGFVLLKAEGEIAESGDDKLDAPGDDGDDSHYRGDMT